MSKSNTIFGLTLLFVCSYIYAAEQTEVIFDNIELKTNGLQGSNKILATAEVEVNSSTAIPDNQCPNTTDIVINVTDNLIITDLNLGLVIDHTFRGDLDVTLVSPAMTEVTIVSGSGGGHDDINAQFDDESSNGNLPNNSTPSGDADNATKYRTDFTPIGNLSDFDGENSNGDWILKVCDFAAQDTGEVDHIRLQFTGDPPADPAPVACAIPGKDAATTTISGTTNTYLRPANGTYGPSSQSIAVSSRRGSSTNIAPGDLVLIMQMQCANINFTNTSAYGDGNGGDTELGSPVARGYTDPAGSCLAGQYEYVRAGAGTTSTSLDLTENSLQNTYIRADGTNTLGRRTFQVVRVPQYEDVALSGNLTAASWNGDSGGLIVLDVTGTLDLAGNNFNANGRGFRGGGGIIGTNNTDNTMRFVDNTSNQNSSKGEGIAGTPRFVSNKRSTNTTPLANNPVTDLGANWNGYPTGTSSDGDFGRGAPGNAGGGDYYRNDFIHNGGGGGGGNGANGGRGSAGYRVTPSAATAFNGINANYSNLNDNEKIWGFGGGAFAASVDRVVFGGGGGAGGNNGNSTIAQVSGAAGGGIVMIRARTITGTSTINVRGAHAANNTGNDAAGGGGAGGSVVIISSDMSGATINVNAQGGNGGDAFVPGTTSHGGGGGGSGGVVISTEPLNNVNTSGGTPGSTNTDQNQPGGATHGASSGEDSSSSTISPDADPFPNVGFKCRDYGDAGTAASGGSEDTYGYAGHNLGLENDKLKLGAIAPDGDSGSLSSIHTPDADADGSDEDGVTLPTASTVAGIYTTTATVLNDTGSPATVCGWVDFDQDGVFQADEGVCVSVPSSPTSQSVNLVFTVPVEDRNGSGTLVSRFRLSTDTLTENDMTGTKTNGEVEAFTSNASILPVSIHHFASKKSGDWLKVNWSTSSETQNIGFHIWADVDGKLTRLNSKLIPSKNEGVLRITNYSSSFRIKEEIEALAITAVDTRGEEELFGMYNINTEHGRKSENFSIDWKQINHEIESAKPQFDKAKNKIKSVKQLVENSKVIITPKEYGPQVITYSDLINAGVDISKTPTSKIAISVNGKPVSRFIGKKLEYNDIIFKTDFVTSESPGEFSEDMMVVFWSQKPDFPDARYIDMYNYQLSIDEDLVKEASYKSINSTILTESYLERVFIDENIGYSFTAVDDDPWYAKTLFTTKGNESSGYIKTFDATDVVANQTSKLKVNVSGGYFDPADPDHEVAVYVNDSLVTTKQFDGLSNFDIEADIPAGAIIAGNNKIEVRLTGATNALYDIVNIDTIEVLYPRQTLATQNKLNISQQSFTSDMTIALDSGMPNDMAALGFDGENLLILENLELNNNLIIATNQASSDYSISPLSTLIKPELSELIVSQKLVESDINYLIISHESFLQGIDQSDHPLNTYKAKREQEGWKIDIVNVKQIQNKYTDGMALPQAVQLFFKDAKIKGLDHVLLVGSDSYDYKNYLGLNSVSYIPTFYTSTYQVPHTPSDGLLVDFNDDKLADIAIGRWPVRTMGDLNSVVTKTLSWEAQQNLKSIIVTDADDTDFNFEKLSRRVTKNMESLGWNSSDIIQIHPQTNVEKQGSSLADATRKLMFDEWEKGQTLTSYIGHGSPTQWSRQGIMNSGDLSELSNSLTPTLIGTLTCYTTYFVSPESNSLALNLMNGMNGMNGATNGAVAIHGAATLSSYGGNQVFADEVIKYQVQGKTLGESIKYAKRVARKAGSEDQVLNWILLGDPTLRIEYQK